MSDRGMDFLEFWMQAKIKAGGNAAELARRCTADAMKGGITREEMEEEAVPRPSLQCLREGTGRAFRAWPD